MISKVNKSFLRSLEKSMEHAEISRAMVFQGMQIAGASNKESCEKYITEIEVYLRNCERMLMAFRIAYGKGSKSIASEALDNYVFSHGQS